MEEIDEKTLTIANQHHFFTTCAWDALRGNAKRMTFLMMNTEKCSNHEFLLAPRGDQPHAKTVAWPYDLQGHAQQSAWNVASRQTKRQSTKTRFQILVWMITISRRKSSNQMEKYLNYAHKLSWNACTWHELVDPTFYGQ